MKQKIKMILSSALVFVLGVMVLSACGTKNNNSQNALTLAEAKAIIVNALAVEGKENNRNLIEKLGRFDYYNSYKNDFFESSEYHDGVYLKCVSQETYNGSIIKYYHLEGEGSYQYNSNRDPKVEMGNYACADSNSMFGNGLWFTDEFFNVCYQNTVEKKVNQNGYSLILKMDYDNYVNMLVVISGASSEAEIMATRAKYASMPESDRELMGGTMEIVFTNDNQIIGVKENMAAVSEGSENGETVITVERAYAEITKRTAMIEEPAWVTEYKKS